MTRYVAFLRGINVGKNNRVAMADLRRLLADLGATQVTTLLQSGNAVFTSAAKEDALAKALRAALAAELDVDVPVVIRTVEQLAAAIAENPLAHIATNPKTHLLGFLSAAPDADRTAELESQVAARKVKGGKDSADEFVIVDDHVHLWCAVNVHESLFATLKWDRILGVEVTMRNWDTVTKLRDLAVEPAPSNG